MNPLADTLMCPSSGHSIGPEANLREAACLLLQHGHSSLFVTDLHGRLLGRVTEDELLQALFAAGMTRLAVAGVALAAAHHVVMSVALIVRQGWLGAAGSSRAPWLLHKSILAAAC